MNLEIRHGEFITFLGPSGCGKTTLLRLIAGLLAPDVGEIRVDGITISTPRRVTPPEDRGMGMVFQNYALWPHMDVFDNVAFGLRRRGIKKVEITARVRRALQLVQLQDMESRYPRELSGGQQQRVALCRALVVEPAVLLLDEPLSNLDARVRDSMREQLTELHDRTGIAFVYVTHDQAEALSMSDRVVVLEAGRVLQAGAPRVVYETPATRRVADLVGQITWLEGEVLDGSNAKTAVIRVQDIFLIRTERSRLPSQDGRRVLVGLRPEHLSLEDRRVVKGHAEFHGTVQRVVYQGSVSKYLIACADGVLLAVQSRSSDKWVAKTDLAVVVDEEKCIIVGHGDVV